MPEVSGRGVDRKSLIVPGVSCTYYRELTPPRVTSLSFGFQGSRGRDKYLPPVDRHGDTGRGACILESSFDFACCYSQRACTHCTYPPTTRCPEVATSQACQRDHMGQSEYGQYADSNTACHARHKGNKVSSSTPNNQRCSYCN